MVSAHGVEHGRIVLRASPRRSVRGRAAAAFALGIVQHLPERLLVLAGDEESVDLAAVAAERQHQAVIAHQLAIEGEGDAAVIGVPAGPHLAVVAGDRSEEHTSELQSLMRISYAVFCLKKKN